MRWFLLILFLIIMCIIGYYQISNEDSAKKTKIIICVIGAILCLNLLVPAINLSIEASEYKKAYKKAEIEFSTKYSSYDKDNRVYKSSKSYISSAKSAYEATVALRNFVLFLSVVSGIICFLSLKSLKKSKASYLPCTNPNTASPSNDTLINQTPPSTCPEDYSKSFNINDKQYTITATITRATSKPTLVSNIEYMVLQKMHKKCYEDAKRLLDFDEEEIDEVMNRFVADGYMRELAENEKISAMTVDALKTILRNHNLKVSGKKDELIQRIIDNSELIGLDMYTSDIWYERTEAGTDYYQGMITEYTTAAMDEICEIVKAIFNCNYSKAFELSGSNCKTTLIKEAKNKNGDFLGSCIIAHLLTGKKFNQAIIDYCYRSICDNAEDSTAPDYDYFTDKANEILELRELEEYKEADISKYEILCALDSKTCEHCKSLDRQIFNVSDAVIGKNFPPFHSGCRCTTIAHFEN